MCMNLQVLSVVTALISFASSQSSYYNAADSRINQQSLFKCEEEGFHPDPQDCRVYYRCVNWGNSSPLTSFKFECDPGTVFSKSKGNICVHPSGSERSECGDVQNEIDTDWQKSSVTSLSTMSSRFAAGRSNEIGQYECTQEGFMEDAKDCSKFYRCVTEGYNKYMKYEFTCGPGTVWDQQIQACNHPWAVSRKECRNSFSDTGMSTSKWNGKMSTQQPVNPNRTPAPSTYSVYPGQFDISSYPVRPNNPTSPAVTSSFGRPTTFNNAVDLAIPATPSSSILPPKQGIPNFYGTASSPGRSGTLGRPAEFETQPTSAGKFDTAATPGFYGKSQPSQQEFTRPPGSSGFEGNTGKPSQPTESGAGTGSCSQEGFFPDPQNCRKFYRCVDEGSGFKKFEFDCGAGTGWDSKLQTCNHLYLLPNCNSEIDTSDKGSESGPHSPSSSSSPNLIENTSPSQSVSSTYLPSNTLGPSTLPTTSATSSPTRLTTKPGANSSPSVVSPTYLPANTAKPSTPSYDVASNTVSTTGGFPTPSSSQTSENTNSGQSPTDSGQASMTPSSTTSLPQSEPTKPGSMDCQGDGFFPNVNDCRKFYRCVKDMSGYRRFDFDCGPGTAWDQGLQTCNYIAQVSTCKSTNNEIVQNTDMSSATPTSEVPPTMTSSTPNENIDKPGPASQSPEVSSSTSTTGDKPAMNGPSPTPTAPSTAPSTSGPSDSNKTSDGSSKAPSVDCSTPKPNNTIVCNVPGFYAHPTRCDKFYRCVDNENGFNVYHFDCAPGTIFDPSISVCNHPESVYPARDCSLGSPSSSPSSTAPMEPSAPESSTMAKPTENVTSVPETASQETSTESKMPESTMEMTSPETTTSETSSESSTTEVGNETTQAAATGSETTAQTGESSATTEPNDMASTEMSATVTEQSSAPTEMPSETSTSAESTTATDMSQETTPMASTETPNTDQETTTQAMTSDSTMPPNADFANCPIAASLTDEQVLLVCPTGFRRHPKFCNLLYQCTSEGDMQVKILTLSCPENMIFDEMKVQCVPEAESSQPCMGSTSLVRSYRRTDNHNSSLVKLSSQSICPSEGHYPFREGCSGAFYKCKNSSRGSLQGYLYKCPKDFVYWSVSRRCERATRLPMCTRLGNETETDSWETRWEVPIEDNNLSARMIYLE